MDALAEMYSLLNEEDMWAGLWQQRCRYPETATAIAYETQGFYEQAQSAYEMVIEKFLFSMNLRWRLTLFAWTPHENKLFSLSTFPIKGKAYWAVVSFGAV